MNILFLNSTKEKAWGGIEKWMLITAIGLREKGYNIFCGGKPNAIFTNRCKESGFITFSMKFGIDFSIINSFRLSRIFKEYQIDIVINHYNKEIKMASIARKILGSKKIIGLTVHNIREAVEAERIGADYVGVSPIFETKTKLDAGRPAGLKLIKDIKKAIKIPFVAIGGINENNLGSVIEAGARSIAAISAIVTKDNVEKECKKFREVIINDSIK